MVGFGPTEPIGFGFLAGSWFKPLTHISLLLLGTKNWCFRQGSNLGRRVINSVLYRLNYRSAEMKRFELLEPFGSAPFQDAGINHSPTFPKIGGRLRN